MWDARARIWAFNIYVIGAVTSLGVGPPVATYLATSPLGWSVETRFRSKIVADHLRRWTFWIAAIVVAVVTILALFLRESRASKLLKTSMEKVASKHHDR